MALSEEQKAVLLAYCRIDDPAQSDLLALEQGYQSAVAYLEGAGVGEPGQGTPRHAQWMELVCALTLDSFDQRGAQAEGGKLADNPVFSRKLNQLKAVCAASRLGACSARNSNIEE